VGHLEVSAGGSPSCRPRRQQTIARSATSGCWSSSPSDVTAFETLYDRYAGHVTGMFLRRLHDEEIADELTQDVFAQLWHGNVRYEPGRARFTTWLFTIVRNRSIDVARSRAVRPPGDELPAEVADDAALDPESATYAAECRARLKRALAELPASQREAVELCIVHGYTHIEAAERLGEPLGTLKSRVKIGLEKLKSSMRSLQRVS
jgi:RNA polymerase sigma-70 factor (ECF subfamily)